MPAETEAPHDLVARTCERFERATGSPLHFRSCRREDVAEVEVQLRAGGTRRWTARLDGPHAPSGVLFLDPPEELPDRDVASLGEMASLVTGLLGDWTDAAALLESRTREFSTLVEIGRSVGTGGGELGESTSRLLRALLEVTRFRAAGFHLLDPRDHTIRLRACETRVPLPIPDDPRALVDGPPDLEALLGDGVTLSRAKDGGDWLPDGVGSAMIVAVPTEDGRVGTLWGYDRRDLPSNDTERDVLRSIAAQLGGVLERSVLREESQDQHRRRAELATVSSDWTFDVVRGLPERRGIDVAALSTTRFEVGGDLCEFVPLDDDRSILVVGDACGDSVPGALVVAAIRGVLHGLWDDSESVDQLCPPEVVARLNRVLCRVTAPSQFASLVYGVVDTARMTFTYTNAGHPCPLHVSGDRVDTLQSHGLLLGVLADSDYEHHTVLLKPDDLIVGFSDGITEAGRRDRMFRSEGVVGAIQSRRDLPVREIVDGIWHEAEECDDETGDDRTLIAVRVLDREST